MDLPGYTYCSKSNRYFKIPIPSSSFVNINLPNESDLNRLKQIELEKKIGCTIRTM